MYKRRFLSEGSSDFASPGAPWKYDSHAACHMRPPTRLWDIGPLFIELARPCKPWARHKLSFDQPPLEIPLGAHRHMQGPQEKEGVRFLEWEGRVAETERERRGETGRANRLNHPDGPAAESTEESTGTRNGNLTDATTTVYTCSSLRAIVGGLIPGYDLQRGPHQR